MPCKIASQPNNKEGLISMLLKTADFAILTELSACTIRDYSDLGLLSPMQNGSSNYRFFDPRLIPVVYLIKGLREMGFSLQQIAVHKEKAEMSKELFRRCCDQLRLDISQLQARLRMMESYQSLVEEGLRSVPGEIGLRCLPELPVRYGSLEDLNRNMKRTTRQLEKERLQRAYGQIRQNGNAGCPLGYVYRTISDFKGEADLPSQLVSFDPTGPDMRPAGEYIVGT
jgi:DNA-binding transcriptional MerR regulator